MEPRDLKTTGDIDMAFSVLETIAVRLFKAEDADLVKLLYKQMNGAMPMGMARPETALLFRKPGLDCDWALHILWKRGDCEAGKTALGRHLAESFRFVGLVSHSVWVASD